MRKQQKRKAPLLETSEINCTVIKAEVDLPDQPRGKDEEYDFKGYNPQHVFNQYTAIKAMMDDYIPNEDNDTLSMRVSDLIISKKSSERRNKKLSEENKRLLQLEEKSLSNEKLGVNWPQKIDVSKPIEATLEGIYQNGERIDTPPYTYAGKNPPTRYFLIEHDDVPETSEMRVTHTTDPDWKILYPQATLVGEYVAKDGATFMDFDTTMLTPLQVFDSLFPSTYDTGTSWYKVLRTALVEYDQMELSLMSVECGASMSGKVEWLVNDHQELLLQRAEMQDIIDNDLEQPFDAIFDEMGKDLHKLYSWFNKAVVIKMVCFIPLIMACLYDGSFIWAALIFTLMIWSIAGE